MLLKACGKCGNLIPYGATYCKTCLPGVLAEREARKQDSRKRSNRNYNKTRDPKYSRFYNSNDWRMLSAKRLADEGYRCAWCGAIAWGVDHIQPIQTNEGWVRRLDYDNTRSLCHACHEKRHKRFTKRS